MSDMWLVELELKRIQTYLFSVPRLRVMIGANALIGETLRGLWTGSGFADDPASLPWLAQKCGAKWPTTHVRFPAIFEQNGDPLVASRDSGGQSHWQDEVHKVAQTGILTRDGGHFEALFARKEDAEKFIGRAAQLVGEKLPGVLVESRCSEICQREGVHAKREIPRAMETPCTENVFDLALAEPCQWSGQEPASACLKDYPDDIPLVGASVEARHARGKEFDNNATYEILGMLRPRLLAAVEAGENTKFPAEFAQLASSRYIGVIHVDGNSVGRRYKKHREGCQSKDFFVQWEHRERFFHTMRCGMRKAVLAAVRDRFQRVCNKRHIPLRILMLGGDDLVLVCGAPHALPFVVDLAKRVTEFTGELTGEDGSLAPLTIGAGVAIVQESFPFHRAHELAEQLASSAKRLKASLPAAEGNVVDWIVSTESWYGDVRETRQRTAVIDGDIVLTAKPYRILPCPGDADPDRRSLEELLVDARHLADLTRRRVIARSQMQRLARSLHDGRHTARFVAEMLPQKLRAELKSVGKAGRAYLRSDGSPWNNDKPPSVTQVHDLLELCELELFGDGDKPHRRSHRPAEKKETADV